MKKEKWVLSVEFYVMVIAVCCLVGLGAIIAPVKQEIRVINVPYTQGATSPAEIVNEVTDIQLLLEACGGTVLIDDALVTMILVNKGNLNMMEIEQMQDVVDCSSKYENIIMTGSNDKLIIKANKFTTDYYGVKAQSMYRCE